MHFAFHSNMFSLKPSAMQYSLFQIFGADISVWVQDRKIRTLPCILWFIEEEQLA